MNSSVDSSLDSTLYSSITSHNLSIQDIPGDSLRYSVNGKLQQPRQDPQRIVETDFKAPNGISYLGNHQLSMSQAQRPTLLNNNLVLTEKSFTSSASSKKRRRPKGVFKTDFRCTKCNENFCNKQALGWHTRKGCRSLPVKASLFVSSGEKEKYIVENIPHNGAHINIASNIGGLPVQFLPVVKNPQAGSISLNNTIPTEFLSQALNPANSCFQPLVRVSNYRPVNIPFTQFIQTPIIGISSTPPSNEFVVAKSIGGNGRIISGHDSKHLQPAIYPPPEQGSHHIHGTFNSMKY